MQDFNNYARGISGFLGFEVSQNHSVVKRWETNYKSFLKNPRKYYDKGIIKRTERITKYKHKIEELDNDYCFYYNRLYEDTNPPLPKNIPIYKTSKDVWIRRRDFFVNIIYPNLMKKINYYNNIIKKFERGIRYINFLKTEVDYNDS